MIIFDFIVLDGDTSKLKKIISRKEYTYPEILKITGKFKILINGKLFFSEEHFPILEFLKYVLAWIDCSEKSKRMSYLSVETEDNPLIFFEKKEGKWIICSPWQKFECPVSFSKDELAYAILELLKNLEDTGDG